MQKYIDVVELEKFLKNAYLGAKIGFDTEENEPSAVCCAAGYQLYLALLSGTQPANSSSTSALPRCTTLRGGDPDNGSERYC